MGEERTDPPFGKVVIIGIGLIGGSLGMAMRARRLAREVVGVARRPETVSEASARGAIDCGGTELVAALPGADLVVIATALGLTRRWCEAMAPYLGPHTMVTDVGSAKEQVVRDATAALHHPAMFVGGHPIAGSEQKGVSHARADLFEGATYVLTPTPETDPGALDRMRTLVADLGSVVVEMDARSHDRLLALTSHLPHVVVSCLAAAVGKITQDNPAARRVIGMGLMDTTRIAAGPADVWTDILIANREQILAALALHLDVVTELVDALRAGDPDRVAEILARGQTARQSWNT